MILKIKYYNDMSDAQKALVQPFIQLLFNFNGDFSYEHDFWDGKDGFNRYRIKNEHYRQYIIANNIEHEIDLLPPPSFQKNKKGVPDLFQEKITFSDDTLLDSLVSSDFRDEKRFEYDDEGNQVKNRTYRELLSHGEDLDENGTHQNYFITCELKKENGTNEPCTKSELAKLFEVFDV